MRLIKVMHVVDSLAIGGLENGVVSLVNGLDPDRFHQAICCIRHSGPSAERFAGRNVPVFEMKKREGQSFLLPLRLARLFRETGVDIVHTRNWGAIDGILSARLAGARAVIHGEHGRDMTDPHGSLRSRNLVRRAISPLVDSYITVSEDLRRWLTAVVGIRPGKVQTIGNGVDTKRFNPEDKARLRAQHGCDDHTVILGTVGRLDPVKDQQLLLRAFAEVRKAHPQTRLLIVGDGSCRAGLERLAGELGLGGEVLFTGLRKDVPELLKLLDVFVLPSVIEGISNTILEAMATGVPVVATAVGGNVELVVDGQTGYLVPKEDRDALATAISRYVAHPSLALEHGAAGRLRAVEQFSLPRMISRYEALYLAVAGRRN